MRATEGTRKIHQAFSSRPDCVTLFSRLCKSLRRHGGCRVEVRQMCLELPVQSHKGTVLARCIFQLVTLKFFARKNRAVPDFVSTFPEFSTFFYAVMSAQETASVV
jgi:hypothetical protein